MKTCIKHADVVTKDQILRGGWCLIEDEIILEMGEADTPAVGAVDRVIDAGGCYLMPGFIDLHCHGGNGFDFMDATPEEMEQIARFHLRHGTTTLFATTMTDGWDNIRDALERIGRLLESGRQLNIAGVHLEGPWLSPAQCGAQNTDGMDMPDVTILEKLVKQYPFIKRVSAAPELPRGHEVGEAGVRLGLVMSAAHTDADFDRMEQAVEHGYTLMTHLYSGMKLTERRNAFRVAGAVEAGLYDDRLCVELIADGRHLPEALLKFAYHCKGAENICLVTDAMRGAGMPEGSCTKLGRMQDGVDVIIEDGVAKLPDRTSFAGSVATADRLLRTMHRQAGVDILSVSKMLSGTPARVMGYTDRGQIESGMRADLVLVNKNNFTLDSVFLGGKEYESKGF